ncbi:MAG: methyltransferase domain-containing protein, partial [Nannocystaceae bacterium]
MQHLPAYVALERWAATRRVVVVAPTDAEGPRRLLRAGARGVIVVGGELPATPGIERYPGVPDLPVGDATIDMVLCVEAYATLAPEPRRELLREAYRVLRPGGLFAAWIRHPPGPEDLVDFWTLEEELGTVYERTYMLAQMPWRGFSLAPVLDGDPETPAAALTLDEGLLETAPEASHYLAIAFRQRPPAKLVERLTAECLLVPLPDPEDEHERSPTREVERVDERAESLVQEATQSLREQIEQARAREQGLQEQLQALQQELGAARSQAEALEHDLERLRESAKAEAATKTRELEQSLGRRLATARVELQQEQERTRVLEQDLGQRLRSLQVEVEQAREQARSLDDGLEHRVAQLQEQAEQLQAQADRARERAQELERSLAEVEAEDLGGQLEQLRQQLEQAQATAAEAEAQRVQLQEQLRTKSTDLTVLTATVKDLEQSLARMSERVEARARELETQATARAELQQRYDVLADERDQLIHQIEVAIAEREGARQLAARVEAELGQVSKRHGEQAEQLAAKAEEASRLAGEQLALRERLQHQEAMLDLSRSRAEELSATAAKGSEQGRMLAEVARDRDQLREELSRRAAEIDKLEERLWTAREEVQKERLDAVRLTGELERLREQAERAREAELNRNRELEQLGAELRRFELEGAQTQALLSSRDEQIDRQRRDLEAMSTESADLASLRADLQARGRELAAQTEALQGARAREQDAVALAGRLEAQLLEASSEREQLKRAAEEGERLHSGLRSELDVKALESEQLAASVADLQQRLEEARSARRKVEAAAEQTQRRLEVEAAEQESLRRRLRTREQELEDLVTANESSGVELYKLRRELEAAAQANEQLEEALSLHPDVEEGPTLLQEQQWPEDAIAEVRRLKRVLADRSRQHAEQLARIETRAEPPAGLAGADDRRLRLLELEVTVRSEEQEHLLGLLESAEQKIWEMTDASDRNAARLAASLAQLEKHKEQIDELHDELEVGRKLLAASQARALEQERLLASERHKLARAGIGPDGLPPSVRGSDPGQEVDDLFAELEIGGGGTSMVELEGPPPRARVQTGAPTRMVTDRSGSRSSPGASRSGSRMVVEPMAD